jgi:hypothetical protein
VIFSGGDINSVPGDGQINACPNFARLGRPTFCSISDGVNTAIVSRTYAIILQRLSVPDPIQLVRYTFEQRTLSISPCPARSTTPFARISPLPRTRSPPLSYSPPPSPAAAPSPFPRSKPSELSRGTPIASSFPDKA